MPEAKYSIYGRNKTIRFIPYFCACTSYRQSKYWWFNYGQKM